MDGWLAAVIGLDQRGIGVAARDPGDRAMADECIDARCCANC